MMVRIRDGHPNSQSCTYMTCVCISLKLHPPGAAILALRYLITSLICEPTALPKSHQLPEFPRASVMTLTQGKPFFLMCWVVSSSVTHLVGGHLADGVSGLQGLQLVQAPVQLLQGLGGQFLVGLLWGETGKGVISFEAFDRASRGFPNIVHIVDSHAGMSTWVTLHAVLKRSGIADQMRDAPCPLLTPDPAETIKRSHSAVSPALKGSWCIAHQSPMLLENKTHIYKHRESRCIPLPLIPIDPP